MDYMWMRSRLSVIAKLIRGGFEVRSKKCDDISAIKSAQDWGLYPPHCVVDIEVEQ